MNHFNVNYSFTDILAPLAINFNANYPLLDIFSIEGSIIAANTLRWPFLLDPQDLVSLPCLLSLRCETNSKLTQNRLKTNIALAIQFFFKSDACSNKYNISERKSRKDYFSEILT